MKQGKCLRKGFRQECSDQFWIPPQSFGYHMKAAIFLITLVKWYGYEMMHLKGTSLKGS